MDRWVLSPGDQGLQGIGFHSGIQLGPEVGQCLNETIQVLMGYRLAQSHWEDAREPLNSRA